MALIACRECGNRISPKAAACPSCGAPQKRKRSVVSTGCGCLLVGCLLVGLFAMVAMVAIPIALNDETERRVDKPNQNARPQQTPIVAAEQATQQPELLEEVVQTKNESTTLKPDKTAKKTRPSDLSGVGVRVESLIVKKTKGKHRYFFSIRNEGKKPFTGDVTILLLNNQPGVVNGQETFVTKSPIQPKGGQFVFVEVETGPVSVHGEWGVKRFRYEVRSSNQIVAKREGDISAKYEDYD